MSNFSSGGGISPSGSAGRRGMSAGTIVAIVVGMVLLFAAGFGVSRLLGGSGSTSGSGGDEPLPCVTTTVTPGAGLPKPATVVVNVYNATDRSGLARKTGAEMTARGFKVGKVANDPLGKSVVVSAEIRHGPAGLSQAKLVQFYVPGSVLVADDRKDATVDLVLGEGFTAVAPKATVDKALAAPSPTSSGPGCASPTPSGSATPAATSPAATTAAPARS